MVTERTIINGLIIGATFILAPFIITETLWGDLIPAAIAGVIFSIIVAFFWIKERLSVCPLLGSYILATTTVLPVPVTAPHVAIVLLIGYYITGFVLLTQRPISPGKAVFFWPIVLMVGIVVYHVHTLSLGAAGGSTEGARGAFLMYAYTLAYFCGINLPTPSVAFLSRIPLYAVWCVGLSSIPYLLTTIFPSLAPYLYLITSNVNVEAYRSTEGGTQDVSFENLTSKLAVFGPLASTIQIYLLAHYPFGTWFQPRRLWVMCLSLVCCVLAVLCGYRSQLFSFFFLSFMGMFCYYSFRAFVLPLALFVMMVVFITAADNNLIHLPLRSLPMIAQRTMSFLPGDWDPEAIESGKSSNEFRQSIIDVYMSEYASTNPLFGNGFEIDKAEFNALMDELDHGTGDRDTSYLQAKVFITGKMFHTGWISVYDCVGLVGWAGFIWFQAALILVMASFIFGRNADRSSSLFPLYVWLECNLCSGVASYYTVFGSFSQSFVDEICYAIVIMHLCKLRKQNQLEAAPGKADSQVGFSGLSQTNYGNKYY